MSMPDVSILIHLSNARQYFGRFEPHGLRWEHLVLK